MEMDGIPSDFKDSTWMILSRCFATHEFSNHATSTGCIWMPYLVFQWTTFQGSCFGVSPGIYRICTVSSCRAMPFQILTVRPQANHDWPRTHEGLFAGQVFRKFRVKRMEFLFLMTIAPRLHGRWATRNCWPPLQKVKDHLGVVAQTRIRNHREKKQQLVR